jgi:hypothetical protein
LKEFEDRVEDKADVSLSKIWITNYNLTNIYEGGKATAIPRG